MCSFSAGQSREAETVQRSKMMVEFGWLAQVGNSMNDVKCDVQGQ